MHFVKTDNSCGKVYQWLQDPYSTLTQDPNTIKSGIMDPSIIDPTVH